ncbi:pilus assembly protein Flp/PilA [Vibrio crassostreae]|nr:pilus assembly protein Flp/PilA [Vibrio crassostreae]CAK3444821.1 pilus assembly protein Flp/PilA [Vibrio crassostreae]CAK3489437.1 pilus assembly protein Flp/PilA [Vibrio crassostreae]CAK3504394.1 pilus assembly protein Flp/PilA [Vibrio crassostreae]CAK3525179.1 pilus assembly protein Flp/PilA [Vibrio crassostreae]
MDKFLNNCKEFMKDEEGLTVIEYVIGAALLVLGLTTVFSGLGTTLATKLNAIVANVGTTTTPTP